MSEQTGGTRGTGTMTTEQNAFSRPFAVDRLAARGETATTVRAETEVLRAAIAARLRIPALLALAVRWTLRASAGGAIEADGVLEATVVQDCVVTLEPFEAPLAERFRVLFVPVAEVADERFEDDDLDAPDTIPFEGGTIDLGEASVEQLALALDPFPRRPGAAFQSDGDGLDVEGPDADGTTAVSPFAVLAARRAGRREDER